jgi:hypothetical protein
VQRTWRWRLLRRPLDIFDRRTVTSNRWRRRLSTSWFVNWWENLFESQSTTTSSLLRFEYIRGRWNQDRCNLLSSWSIVCCLGDDSILRYCMSGEYLTGSSDRRIMQPGEAFLCLSNATFDASSGRTSSVLCVVEVVWEERLFSPCRRSSISNCRKEMNQQVKNHSSKHTRVKISGRSEVLYSSTVLYCFPTQVGVQQWLILDWLCSLIFI